MLAVLLFAIRDLVLSLLLWNSSGAAISADLQMGAIADAFDALTSEIAYAGGGVIAGSALVSGGIDAFVAVEARVVG